MDSFFRTSFGSAYPFMFGQFSDLNQKATYTDQDGNTTPNLNVIWRAESTDLAEDSDGDVYEARIVQAVFRTDELSAIDTQGKITYGGEDWDIDAREGRGIESNNPSALVVHLIKRDMQTISNSGRRVE